MDRLIHLLARKNGYMDLIRYIETAALTQVLDTIRNSRASPSLRKSSVTVISKATVKRPSLATNQPGYPQR